jgi:hypothetical protein
MSSALSKKLLKIIRDKYGKIISIKINYQLGQKLDVNFKNELLELKKEIPELINFINIDKIIESIDKFKYETFDEIQHVLQNSVIEQTSYIPPEVEEPAVEEPAVEEPFNTYNFDINNKIMIEPPIEVESTSMISTVVDIIKAPLSFLGLLESSGDRYESGSSGYGSSGYGSSGYGSSGYGSSGYGSSGYGSSGYGSLSYSIYNSSHTAIPFSQFIRNKYKYKSSNPLITVLNIDYISNLTNFGHNKVIFKTDFKYNMQPTKTKEFLDQIETNYKSTITPLLPHNGIKIGKVMVNKIKTTYFEHAPTLVISLFISTENMLKQPVEIQYWIDRYLINHIKLILIWKYYFPNSNIKFYLDFYLIKFFSKFKHDDFNIIIPYNDYYFEAEETKVEDVARFLNAGYEELKAYDGINFKNFSDKILFLFHLCSRVQYSSGAINFTAYDTIDTFIYKLGDPFIDKNYSIESHVDNGYIGQLMRYIALRQMPWIDDLKNIVNKHKHHVYRDSHSATPRYTDIEWIKAVNKISISGKELYLMPTSPYYINQPWHLPLQNPYNGKIKKTSTCAGIVQYTNSSMPNDDLLWLKTIGIGFIVNNNKLLFREDRGIIHPALTREAGIPCLSYDYGSDEYLLSYFLINNFITKRTIYYTTWFPNLVDSSFLKLIYLLVMYIYKTKYPSNNIRWIDFINELEKLRKKTNHAGINLLLSIIPNKYHDMTYVYNTEWFSLKPVSDYMSRFVTNNIRNPMSQSDMDILDDIALNHDLNYDKLISIGITCEMSAFANIYNNWYSDQYLFPKTSIKHKKCSDYDFFSGQYATQPTTNIAQLDTPESLSYVYSLLEKNKFAFPLNISNYKLHVEKPNLQNAVTASLTMGGEGTFHDNIKDIVYKYGDNGFFSGILGSIFGGANTIGEEVRIAIENDFTAYDTNLVLCKCVWKALNIYGYDVPPEWFNIDFNNDDDYKKFNELAKKLLSIDGWALYTMHTILSAKTDNLESKVDPDVKASDYSNQIKINKVALDNTYDKNYSMSKIMGGGSFSLLTLSIGTLIIILLIILLAYFVKICNNSNKKLKDNNLYSINYDNYLEYPSPN